MKKPVLIIITFFVIAITFIFINGFIQSRREYVEKYDFVIKNIKTDIKGNLIFYDSLHNKYRFVSHRFSKHFKLGISTGDKIFKDYHSKYMIIYRQVNNKYQIYYIQKPNGQIPFSFYSY
jgi:hypothetical protein